MDSFRTLTASLWTPECVFSREQAIKGEELADRLRKIREYSKNKCYQECAASLERKRKHDQQNKKQKSKNAKHTSKGNRMKESISRREEKQMYFYFLCSHDFLTVRHGRGRRGTSARCVAAAGVRRHGHTDGAARKHKNRGQKPRRGPESCYV